jgi:hypothetical protein
VLNLDDILTDLDFLLNLYAFVEGGDDLPPAEETDIFRPGCSIKKVATKAYGIATERDIALRHNELQYTLYQALCKEYGAENVKAPYKLSYAGEVDVAVCREESMIFFEIKTAPYAKSALREAVGQILEYAYWPNVDRFNPRDYPFFISRYYPADYKAILNTLKILELYGFSVARFIKSVIERNIVNLDSKDSVRKLVFSLYLLTYYDTGQPKADDIDFRRFLSEATSRAAKIESVLSNQKQFLSQFREFVENDMYGQKRIKAQVSGLHYSQVSSI